MKPYAEMTKEELMELRKTLKAQYREYQGKDLKLDMSRGKPCVEQLDRSLQCLRLTYRRLRCIQFQTEKIY